jgi:polyether ionophore transport system permease protein
MTSLLMGLRLGRWGMVGFSLTALAWNLTQTIGFYQVVGHSLVERATFGASIATLATKFVVIVPPPIRPDTVGGYVEFRGFHELAIIFSIWALASAVGFARGDEERGIVDAVLAAGESRIALVASRAAAFAIAVAIASTAAGAAFVIGVASGHESVEPLRVVQTCALLVAIGLACYGIALLVAQLASPHSAAQSAGIVLLALFLLNSLSRQFGSLSSWRWLSPFRYYDLSQPLPPGGYFNAAGFLVLVLIALVTVAAAALAFERRDLGASLVRLPARTRPPVRDVVAAPWWRIPVVRGVYDQRVAFIVWTLGTSAIAVLMVSLTRAIVQVLLSLPTLVPYLGTYVRQQVYPTALGYIWFSLAELLFAAFAIVQVARWSAEDTDGRLEMVLSQPVSRAAVVVERMAVLVAGALPMAAISGATLYYSSHLSGIDLNGSRLAAASLMLVPFALVFAAAGSLLAAWNPRAALGLVGAFTLASYLDTELGPIFKLPGWLQDLSAFKLFGMPLLTGIDGRNLALLLLLASAGVGSSILFMQRRDIGA